jgi:predicted Zn-dependent protease
VVRDGEVIGAATNFRFNDSPVGILSRIVDAGATVPTLAREMGDYFNRAAMPPLRIRDFNFSTVSQAN